MPLPDRGAAAEIARAFGELGLRVFERGWLSSNNIVFAETSVAPATVVDTGYVAHSAQTVALLRAALGPVPLGRVINTHLHSDHCGGNAALQAAWNCEVLVPQASFDAVRDWDEDKLSYRLTGQRCDRFAATGALAAGDVVMLGHRPWQAIGAGGHDPDALMFWQPDSGVLITADALWHDRLAIIFPEYAGESGFGQARATLVCIEQLAPRIVIPGHGSPFTDVDVALSNSRRKLDQFEADPLKHLLYGSRALTMFHLLEHRVVARDALVGWLLVTPIFDAMLARIVGPDSADRRRFASTTVDRLVADGLLRAQADGTIAVASD